MDEHLESIRAEIQRVTAQLKQVAYGSQESKELLEDLARLTECERQISAAKAEVEKAESDAKLKAAQAESELKRLEIENKKNEIEASKAQEEAKQAKRIWWQNLGLGVAEIAAKIAIGFLGPAMIAKLDRRHNADRLRDVLEFEKTGEIPSSLGTKEIIRRNLK